MDDDNYCLLVILGEATCSGVGLSSKYAMGDRYSIIAIIKADSEEEAYSIFVGNCAAAGWEKAKAKRIGEFVASGDAEYLLNAERDARETGYGWIVYQKILH
ncbi:MAG: hypothetical protein QM647_11885 [Asticcacaulis sp.]|uniref:hypothetical protein n=1 Tax=Asticcacaulis sp. TaxID=1872648 RepID=UPI0039E5399A